MRGTILHNRKTWGWLCLVLAAAAALVAGMIISGPPARQTPQGGDLETQYEEPQASSTEPKREYGITGAEVKEELNTLSEGDRRAVILAMQGKAEETADPAYLVYPMGEDRHPLCLYAEDGSVYPLCGVNYGCVLSQQTIYGIGGDVYQIIGGFLETEVLAERKNYEQSTVKTVIERQSFRPYDGPEISDDARFARLVLMDDKGQEVGSFYLVQEGVAQ